MTEPRSQHSPATLRGMAPAEKARAAQQVQAPEYDDVPTWATLPWKKGVAAAVWLLGAWLTKLVTMLFVGPWLDWLAAWFVQAALTAGESPIWRRWAYDEQANEEYKRPLSFVNIASLLLDNLLNIGGVWLVIKRVDSFPGVRALAEMFGHTGPVVLTGLPAFALCFLLSSIICALPEKLWHDND